MWDERGGIVRKTVGEEKKEKDSDRKEGEEEMRREGGARPLR